MCRFSPPASSSGSSSSESDFNCKALEVDLSFVPTWFWSRRSWDSCCVVAAAHGLVCISNQNQHPHMRKKARKKCKAADRYCVLNQLTRTCIVLPPKLPFQPDMWFLPSSTSVAIYSVSTSHTAWRLATYDLASGAGWARKSFLLPCERSLRSWWVPVGAKLPDDNTVAQGLDPDDLDHVPSPTLLGLDEACGCVTDTSESALVVGHRRTLYFVGQLFMPPPARVAHVRTRQSALCGVWRVKCAADGRPEWKGVALLDASRAIERLTGFTCSGSTYFTGAYTVRELVCFHIVALHDSPADNNRSPQPLEGAWLFGFNLETLRWELVYGRDSRNGDEVSINTTAMMMELRPDLYLSYSTASTPQQPPPRRSNQHSAAAAITKQQQSATKSSQQAAAAAAASSNKQQQAEASNKAEASTSQQQQAAAAAASSNNRTARR